MAETDENQRKNESQEKEKLRPPPIVILM